MKPLTLPGKSEDMIVQQYNDDSGFVIVRIARSKQHACNDRRIQLDQGGSVTIADLNIGIEDFPGKPIPSLVVYTTERSKPKPLAELHFDPFIPDAPFYWINSKLSGRTGSWHQRRDRAKLGLQDLGFDPNIVDRVFPPGKDWKSEYFAWYRNSCHGRYYE